MQTRPIDEFVNCVESIVSAGTADKKDELDKVKSEFKKLVDIVRTYEKKREIITDSDLFEIKMNLQDQINNLDKEFKLIQAKYQARTDSITDAIRTIEERVSLTIRTGTLMEIKDIAVLSELSLQVAETQRDIDEDIEDESCCARLFSFCCPPKKITQEQAKVALLEKKEGKIDTEKTAAAVERHVDRLNTIKFKLVDEKRRHKANPPIKPDRELQEELQLVESEINTSKAEQQKQINSVCKRTALQMITVYQAYIALQPDKVINPLYSLMEKTSCRDINYGSVATLYEKQKQAAMPAAAPKPPVVRMSA